MFQRPLFIILSVFLMAVACTPAQQKKKNVLFIIADDLNDNIGAYGHYLAKTPNIDRLAEEGMQFNQAFCNFPLCGPSRASMMTGLYPDQTGHHKLRDLIRDHVPDVVTMSQSFMKEGYTSARVGKIYHYNNPNGIGTPGHDDSLSWHERYYPSGIDREIENKIFSLSPGRFGATLSWLAAEGGDEDHTDGMVATRAIELLKKYKAEDTPFFLGVGFYKPHTPFVAPAKYFEMYDKKDIRVPQVPDNYFETIPEPAVKVLRRWDVQNDLSDSLARSAIHAYYSTISFLDAQVGRVLQAIEELGMKENTLIVFTSDHGYHMGEHGYYQKKTLFELSGKIPLIVYDPSMQGKGAVTSGIVEMIDLYPTICELAGVPTPEYLAGKSFAKTLDDPTWKTRESALTQIDASNGYTIRTSGFRFTRWNEGGEGMIELYDRRSDPEEMKNLAGDAAYKEKIDELSGLLQRRIDEANVPPAGLKVIK